MVGTPQKRRLSSREICADLNLDVSPRTVRRRLVENGLKGCTAAKKPHLRQQNVEKRLSWAKEREKMTKEDWEKVLWTDESPFVLFGGRGRSNVRRREGKRLHRHCRDKTVKHRSGKIHVWGCFTANGVGSFTEIHGSMGQNVYKKILVHHARPSLQHLGADISQQGNDPKHTATKNLNYSNSDRWPAKLMDWPAQSPDLNRIESLWQFLDSKVRKRSVKPCNNHELYSALKEEWQKLNPDYLKEIVHSMPNRCSEVIESKGMWMKY